MPLKSHTGRGLWVILCYTVVLAGTVQAQHPLCPPPMPVDSYYLTCRANTSDRVAKFLYDFSVRHLLKSTDRFEIPTDVLLDAFGLNAIVDRKNPSVRSLLDRHPSIQFIPVDGSSGEFVSTGPKETATPPTPSKAAPEQSGPETVTITNDQLGITLELSVPAVVQGVYWRSPAHLELEFYKWHDIGFHLSGRNVAEYQERLECISVTQERARATTHDPMHRYLMSVFEKCP